MAVACREGQLLVIRRSLSVLAPGKVCFAGGGIEPGETEEMALIRELDEELSLAVQPVRRLWSSVTRWRHALAWWLVEIDPAAEPQPNPAEVESAFWVTAEELLHMPDLLEGNHDFVQAILRGEIDLAPRL